MKHSIILFLVAFISFSVAAQDSINACNQVKVLKTYKSKTLVELTICFNDSVNETIETYLKPKFKKRLFKRKRYLMIRHGKSKKIESNGDYIISRFNDGVLISDTYYLKSGAEISLKEYEMSHTQLYFINGTTEYYKEGKIYIIVKI